MIPTLFVLTYILRVYGVVECSCVIHWYPGVLWYFPPVLSQLFGGGGGGDLRYNCYPGTFSIGMYDGYWCSRYKLTLDCLCLDFSILFARWEISLISCFDSMTHSNIIFIRYQICIWFGIEYNFSLINPLFLCFYRKESIEVNMTRRRLLEVIIDFFICQLVRQSVCLPVTVKMNYYCA